MAETVMDQIVAELRASAHRHYPEHAPLKNVRIVGHTPKADHFIYDVVIDFEDGSERLAAKVYRTSRNGRNGATQQARIESDNIRKVHGIFSRKKLDGVPRPIGDFSDIGAVVAEKVTGVPLQSIIMKAALLPGYADNGALNVAATMTGHWLRNFHKATADMPEPFDSAKLLREVEAICQSCKSEGLEDHYIRNIGDGAKRTLNSSRRSTLPSSAVLGEFTPLNVIVCEKGIGISDFVSMKQRGVSFHDVAHFLACIESLERYPFCNRKITTQLQEHFLEAYHVTPSDMAVLRVLKMKELLQMFAAGRNTPKEAALRKKVMWANVMKRFIHQAAHRALAPAA
jgi:hypothetical protein